MQTGLSHLQVNVQGPNIPFYKDLMAFLGWQVLYDGEGAPGVQVLGAQGTNNASLWFIGAANGASNDYDGPGTNHIAIGASSQADVDAAAAYLSEHGVTALFETPRHRPEFSQSEDSTYYQVMFETPDRLLVEVVYTGPKSG